MRTKLLNFLNFTFNIYRSFADHWCLHMIRLFFCKMKLLEFINLSAGPHATIIGGVCKLFCGKVQNEFLCLADHIVRKSGGTNGDAYHWRVGTHGASPRYCYYIIITLAICNADHHSRKRVKHIAWFPGLFCHILLLFYVKISRAKNLLRYFSLCEQ